ncbi:MAG: lasso peptide biosynthesis B2 protein [Candidatus Ozemobacteraceae bacterium]
MNNFKRKLQKVQRLIRRPLSEKILLFEAAFWLPISRLLIEFIPMRRYMSLFLGKHMLESDKSPKTQIVPFLRKVAWATNAMSRRMPWKNKCFALAISAKMILRFRGIESTLYLGLKKGGSDDLDAHAWLRCGDFSVTGGDGTGFTSVSNFT